VPTISIDKLSITARLDLFENTTLSDYLNKVPYQVEYRHMPWNFIYQHQYNFTECGLFLQLGDFEREKVFRIEFNPNKLKKEHLTFYFNIMKRIKFPNVTRIDWAVDYDEDMSNYEFKQLTARKTIEYRSRSRKLETLYLGSPKSDNFTRVYNKALEKRRSKFKKLDQEEEIEVKEVLWRVESVVKNFEVMIEQEYDTYIEHKDGSFTEKIPHFEWESFIGDEGKTCYRQVQKGFITKEVKGLVKVRKTEKVPFDYVFKNPFDNLEIYKKFDGGSEGLNIKEKALLFFLQYNPDEWDNLSPNTRKKYEKLRYMYEWMPIENQPSEVFEQEKYRLADELESWLRPALDKSKYITDFKSNIYYSLEFMKFQRNDNNCQ